MELHAVQPPAPRSSTVKNVKNVKVWVLPTRGLVARLRRANEE